MRFLPAFFLLLFPIFASSQGINDIKKTYTRVSIKTIFEDSTSIRALLVDNDLVIYAGSNGKYGYLDIVDGLVKNKLSKAITYDNKKPNFRAIAATASHFFVMSIESPALLYKIDKNTGEHSLVYKESNEKAFYDSLIFWNDKEGIAMGDPTDVCLSIIITRDGGNSWTKIPCNQLPNVVEGEAAFAASNTNIAVNGDHTWILSGGIKSRVFYSPDKGENWTVFETPIIQGTATKGGYSIDFYNDTNGVIYGGDYTKPSADINNKAITSDGGKTWKTIGNGNGSGYKSCVQYIPNTKGNGIVAIGFTGIDISNDRGKSWNSISNDGFYTIRFINDSIAIAAGKNKIARLKFE